MIRKAKSGQGLISWREIHCKAFIFFFVVIGAVPRMHRAESKATSWTVHQSITGWFTSFEFLWDCGRKVWQPNTQTTHREHRNRIFVSPCFLLPPLSLDYKPLDKGKMPKTSSLQNVIINFHGMNALLVTSSHTTWKQMPVYGWLYSETLPAEVHV